jgi:hypothetical protein
MNYLEKSFEDFCFLDVKVGTNGFQDGDAGHGCETYLELKFDSATINIEKTNDTVIIKLGGDAELKNLIKGLDFATKSLKLLSEAKVTVTD